MANMRTIGNVLNEAADSYERGMESRRREALTNVQLKGEMDDQKWKEDERNRQREFYKEAEELGKKHFFRRVPRQSQPGAAIPTGEPGSVVAPIEYDEQLIDLASPEGVKAVAAFQTDLFAARARRGLVTPEESEKLVNFRKTVDNMGATESFKKALQGDPDALAEVSKMAGLSGVSKIGVGFDNVGMPQLFAFTQSTDESGKVTQAQVPIGHLAAIYSPEFYKGAVTDQVANVKAADDLKNSASTRRYQGALGDAALKNADTNASKAARSTAAYQQYTVFKDAQKDEDYFVPGFTTQEPGGKPQSIPDDSGRRLVDRLGRIFIEEREMTGGSAHNLAVGTLGEANTEATQRFSGIKSDITAAYNAIQAGKPATLGGQTIDPADRAEVQALKNSYFDLQEPAAAAQLWQRVRDQIMEQKIRELRTPAQSTPSK